MLCFGSLASDRRDPFSFWIFFRPRVTCQCLTCSHITPPSLHHVPSLPISLPLLILSGFMMRSSSRCRKLSFWLLLTLFVSIHSFSIRPAPSCPKVLIHSAKDNETKITKVPRGGWSIIPAGWNPFGYKVTAMGKEFLDFGGSLESDVGRFLASLKTKRKRRKAIKEQWLEIVRASKQGQSMRIYRDLDNLLNFCLRAGLIN